MYTPMNSRKSGVSAGKVGCKGIVVKLASTVQAREALSAQLYRPRHLVHLLPQVLAMLGLPLVTMDSKVNQVN